jgi:hypothetical protein
VKNFFYSFFRHEADKAEFYIFQFNPLLNSILLTDKKLTEQAKELEKTEMERQRQENLAKHQQVSRKRNLTSNI